MPRWAIGSIAAVVALGALGGATCRVYAEPAEIDLRAGVLIERISAQDGEQPVNVGGGGAPVGGKSVVKGMLFSALLPGLGEIYAGGTQGYVTGALLAGADLFSFWQYRSNNGKGDDAKEDYRRLADEHYSLEALTEYVETVVADTSGCYDLRHCRVDLYQESLCDSEIIDVFDLPEEGSDEFYQRIADDERYVMGWDDWDTSDLENPNALWTEWDCRHASGIPYRLPDTTAALNRYRAMRAEADDFYGTADRYASMMVIWRVVSMIHTAILVKIRNSDLAGLGTNPRLSVKIDVLGKPNFRVGLKMRF